MPEPLRDPDLLRPYLEDSAHFPGGKAAGLYRPANEEELVAILKKHQASGAPLLIQGGRTSLTGGATPMGESVVSLENLNQILQLEKEGVATGKAVLQPFVRLKELNEAASKLGLYYPPTPTYDLATIGGTVATCAAGAATFKYGTTRDWVTGLKVILVSGETLTLERGKCYANDEGIFETETDSGHPLRIPMPQSYTTPIHLKKVSCGYMAAPHLDLVDFFIGSEGTLGVITEIKVRLILKPEFILSGLAFFDSEEQAFEFVKAMRELRHLDVRAIEFMDHASLALLVEAEIPRKLKIPIPEKATSGIYFEIELRKPWQSAEAFKILETFLEKLDSADTQAGNELEHLFRELQLHGALNLDELILAFPQDTDLLQQLWKIREAIPEQINERVSRLQAKEPQVTKMAADVIVPFERIPEMIQAFRHAAKDAFLEVIIFGHISDGNLHPNILVHNPHEVAHAKNCLRQAVKEVLELGGAPMAEHGVGRNPLKQEFLKNFYGEEGLQEMAQAKLALDPRGILSPGVLFPKEYLKKAEAIVKNVGDEQGELWRFSLKSLTKTQNFVNGFLARFLERNPQAELLMKELQQIGHKVSGYLTDYIAIPYSVQRVQELKRCGFIQDKETSPHVVFRHMEGIFPPFIIRPSFLEPIDPSVLEEDIPIEYEFDEEDIWVPLKDVWEHLPTLEESYKKIAKENFPFITESEAPEIEVGWRIGNFKHFKITEGKIEGGPLYRKALHPKLNDQETQLAYVQRKIGIYNGFDTSKKGPKLSLFFRLRYAVAKIKYELFHELFIFLFGMERLVQFLIWALGPKWTRHLLNEVHDAQWLQNTPKGKRDKENVEKILGVGGWPIFVDHRTLRRSLLPHLSLWDRFLRWLGVNSKKSMGQNEVCYRVLVKLGLEKHEDYVPNKTSDWKARVMRDRSKQNRKTRSQLAYFLDEALPQRRGNIATYAAFWGAGTGWGAFDWMLAFFRFDWGPDPWYFHHIAIEGNFEQLAKATADEEGIEDYVTSKKVKNADEIGFLERFSFMWFLRQVFSKEIRFVPHRRLQALYLAGRLTHKEYEKYREAEKNKKTLVEGPHLEIIDRRSGIPWFNQVRVTQAIATSSAVRVESNPNENQDLFEPWKKRIETLFGGGRR